MNVINNVITKPELVPTIVAIKTATTTTTTTTSDNAGTTVLAQAETKVADKVADSKSTDSKPADDSKASDKKDDKKETVVANKDVAAAKKDEPVRKLYCN